MGKKYVWISLLAILLLFPVRVRADQTTEIQQENTSKKEKWVIVISHPNSEVMWNAFRYAIFLLKHNKDVGIFMQGPAVDYRRLHTKQFPISDLVKSFVHAGGDLKGWGKCMAIHGVDKDKYLKKSGRGGLYHMIKDREGTIVLCFWGLK